MISLLNNLKTIAENLPNEKVFFKIKKGKLVSTTQKTPEHYTAIRDIIKKTMQEFSKIQSYGEEVELLSTLRTIEAYLKPPSPSLIDLVVHFFSSAQKSQEVRERLLIEEVRADCVNACEEIEKRMSSTKKNHTQALEIVHEVADYKNMKLTPEETFFFKELSKYFAHTDIPYMEFVLSEILKGGHVIVKDNG